jgi:chromosome segregation ATPase|tara:strand:+ start:122 stop:481 length:360 start_codon:yes stop_codon:yes gene_type:complete
MLELGPRELVTLATVLTGLAATWGVLKTTIRGIVSQLEEAKQELSGLNTRLDKVEAKMAVAISSIDTMSNDILAPQILKKQSERDGAVEERLKALEREISSLHAMHNTTHPPVESKSKE